MRRQLLRPFLPDLWTSQSPATYSTEEIEERVNLTLIEIEAEYDLSTFRLESFAKWVEAKRRRPIQFVPLRFPSAVSGGWLKFDDEDLVFYEKDALPIYQVHVQLHELSHMLCGHQSITIDNDINISTADQFIDYLSELFENPGQFEDESALVGFRSNRSSAEEFEAEYLSTRILERCSVRHFERVLTQPVTFSKMAIDIYEAMRMN